MAKVSKQLSFLDRYLTFWIFIAMIVAYTRGTYIDRGMALVCILIMSVLSLFYYFSAQLLFGELYVILDSVGDWVHIRIIFDNYECPVENRLGAEGEGFKIAMTVLDAGRIGIASQALGIAEGGVGLARNKFYDESTPDEVKKLVDEAEEKILKGEVTVESAFN